MYIQKGVVFYKATVRADKKAFFVDVELWLRYTCSLNCTKTIPMT